jgi:hypothetical protein
MSARNPLPLSAADTWDALQHIPAHDREIWIHIGMALKSEFGDEGYSLFDGWSQTSNNYSEKAAREVWRSFKAGGIGIGTLIHAAKAHGWRSPGHSAPRSPLPQPKAAPAEMKADTGAYAAKIWLSSEFIDEAVAGHPYAVKKGITHAGGAARGSASGKIIGSNADCIIIPIRDLSTEKVIGVQTINAEGAKQTFGPVSGNGLILGNTLEKSAFPWYVAEGWASAYSMVFHHQHGHGVCAVSFGKHNQDTLAERIAEIHAPDEIIILVEADA